MEEVLLLTSSGEHVEDIHTWYNKLPDWWAIGETVYSSCCAIGNGMSVVVDYASICAAHVADP